MTCYYSVRLPPLELGEKKIDCIKQYIKKDKKNLLEKKINNLPDVLIKEVFGYLLPISNIFVSFDYIKYYLWLEEFKKAFYSSHSQRLDIVNIRPWIPRILAFPIFADICFSSIPYLKIVWQQEKNKNKKSFVLMNRGNSFAQALLMYMYH